MFILGHATFVIVPAMNFSPTGTGNRALVAAAVGVALILAAVVRYAAGLLEPHAPIGCLFVSDRNRRLVRNAQDRTD